MKNVWQHCCSHELRHTALKKSRLPISILLMSWVLALVVTGCDWETTCSTCGVKKWVEFTPAGENFSVAMPDLPTRTKKMVDTKWGQMPLYLYSALAGKNHRFGVIRNTYPSEVDLTDLEKIFQQMEESVLTTDFQLVSKTNIILQGIPGRELVCENEKYVVTLRLYLRDRDAYQVMSLMPRSSVCDKHIHEFMDSFKIEK